MNLFIAALTVFSASAADQSANELFSGFTGFIKKAELDFRLRSFIRDSQQLNSMFMNYEWRERVQGKGFTTTKAQQFYKSVPVVGGMTLVHETREGVELTQTVKDFVISTEPQISAEDAIKISKSLSENKLKSLPELKILPSSDRTAAQLVYFVDTKTEGTNPGETVIVDAVSGKVLAEISKAHTIAPVDIHTADKQGHAIKEILEKKLNPATNQTETEFKGCEVRDLKTGKVETLSQQECVMTLYGYTPLARDSCQVLFEADGSPIFINPLKCQYAVKASKEVGTLSPAAARAFANSKKTLEYYLNKFNRNSFDNKNSTARSVVSVGLDFANAAWFTDEEFMIYGTGDSDFADFTAVLDVAGHELTHGVVSKTANLMMMDEPGALNEATADYFGKMIAGDNNWRIGEGIFLDNPKDAIRDLKNPASLKTRYLNEKGQKELVAYPAKYSDKLKSFEQCGARNDRCYVHANSTIIGHAYYLIQSKIGQEKAENVIYTALTQFFTENTNFKETSEFTQKACAKLYDATTCADVKAAFAEVGL